MVIHNHHPSNLDFNFHMASVVVVLVLSLATSLVVAQAVVYNVVDNGAIGNGQEDDAKAFLDAWRKVCADPGNPTFLIPLGKAFLLSKTTFEGPCKSNIHVQVSGNLVAPNTLWTQSEDTWLTFYGINGLTVAGSAEIDGKGSIWWECKAQHKCLLTPESMGFVACNDLRVSGLRFKDSPGKHMIMYGCTQVHVNGISATAPANSPNTDGLVIGQSQHVQVIGSTFATGDDCIAILSGSSDVNITNISCGPGHGISIGSLGGNNSEARVEQIHVSTCNIFNTMNGVRIKSWQGASGFAKDITFKHINLTSVLNPIIIDQYYCPGGHCANETTTLEVSDVQFVDIHGSSASEVAINFACSPTTPCQDIVLSNVNINLADKQAKSNCRNAQGRSIGKVSPEVPCLSSS